ncbi:hypothetical protein FRZ67_04230 [Panacibacter ginsenosidivorans]|uniref:Uncharacterized protein n=1 Tax=Panacibacter ginsenosidivorans TaxID=1813871 RepID=A0A5B8V577_9BACT|nr:hypothetical protein [Panacibacter ginsenosidivorans]QEC66540.1 hypothetical protein FRZ67_04230 [Panacibacter ginsenosidivorans]
MKYILFITFILLHTTAAYTQSIYDTYAEATAVTDSTSEFFSTVDHQFHLVEELRYKQKNTQQLKEAVDSIPRLLNTWKSIIMNVKDTLDFNLLTIIKSADKTFCIVSWDTRLGDSKIDYASVILYKIKDSIYLQQQKQEFIKSKPENPKIRYTAIYTITTKDRKIFLAKGYGQGRTTEPWQEIKTFCIEDSSLSQPNILPGKKNRILIAINSIELKGIKKIPPLSYDSTALKLTVPVTDKHNIFNGSYTSYYFNSKKFKEIKDLEVRYALVPY